MDINGIWDPAEVFVDENDNGIYDVNDTFTDSSPFNGVWDAEEESTDLNNNSVCDTAEPFTDYNGNGIRDEAQYDFMYNGSQSIYSITNLLQPEVIDFQFKADVYVNLSGKVKGGTCNADIGESLINIMPLNSCQEDIIVRTVDGTFSQDLLPLQYQA
mgnify:CR=1 FL=1